MRTTRIKKAFLDRNIYRGKSLLHAYMFEHVLMGKN